jgi:hypothetical protein
MDVQKEKPRCKEPFMDDNVRFMKNLLQSFMAGKSTLDYTYRVVMECIEPAWRLIIDKKEHGGLIRPLCRMNHHVLCPPKRLRNPDTIGRYAKLGVFVTSDERFDLSMVPDRLYGIILIPKKDSVKLAKEISKLLLGWRERHGAKRLATKIELAEQTPTDKRLSGSRKTKTVFEGLCMTDIAKLIKPQLRSLWACESTLKHALQHVMKYMMPGWTLIMDGNEQGRLADALARMNYDVITTLKPMKDPSTIKTFSARGVFVTSDKSVQMSLVPAPLTCGLILIPKSNHIRLAQKISSLLLHWRGIHHYESVPIATRIELA